MSFKVQIGGVIAFFVCATLLALAMFTPQMAPFVPLLLTVWSPEELIFRILKLVF